MRANLLLVLVVVLSLILGMLLELLPLSSLLHGWVAPWLLILVVFWSLHLPALLGVGTAWIIGLFCDAATSAPLGSHALIFTLASALTLGARRLLLSYSVMQQAFWMALIALAQHGALMLISGQGANSLFAFVQVALSSMLAWVVLHVLFYRWLRP